MELDNFKAENHTHWLRCAHAIGRNRQEYLMKCTLIGKTTKGKYKIVVFGERNWKNKEHIKRIKYVDNSKFFAKLLA